MYALLIQYPAFLILMFGPEGEIPQDRVDASDPARGL